MLEETKSNMETKMKLKWECTKCGEEQTTYLADASWNVTRDRCNDVDGILITPTCVYCKDEETYEKILY